MESLRQPKEMSLEGDIPTNFRKWRQQFSIYMEASGLKDNTKITSERKAAILLHAIGAEVQEIYETMDIPVDDKKDWEKLLQHFELQFKPKENETVNRHLFHTRRQLQGENVDIIIIIIKTVISETCVIV